MEEKVVEFEEVTVGGKRLQLRHQDIPIDKLQLDPNNPRIRYRLQHKQGVDAEQELLGWRDVILLRKDIERTGGLRERIIVQHDEDSGQFKVIEGNCRTVSIRSLNQKYEDDERWQSVPAKVLPPDADQKAVSIMLLDFHVVGKIQWKAHEKAAQVYKMNAALKVPLDEIALYMRTSKSTVQRLLDAYKALNDRFLTIDDSAYEEKGEGAWSFFEELYKSPVLRKKAKADPDFLDEFCRWVGTERLPQGADVRVLPKVLEDPHAYKKFTGGPVKTAFADAQRLIEIADPSITSDFFKLLARVRDSLTSAAQVKEILRIRTDDAARQQLVDTYDALVDFMRLADQPSSPAPARPRSRGTPTRSTSQRATLSART